MKSRFGSGYRIKDFDQSMSIDIDKICRLCLNYSNSIQIFSKLNLTSPNYSELIEMLTFFKINDNDDFPKEICNNCAEKLIQTYHFKLQIENTYFELKKLLVKEEIEDFTISESNDDVMEEIESIDLFNIQKNFIEDDYNYSEYQYQELEIVEEENLEDVNGEEDSQYEIISSISEETLKQYHKNEEGNILPKLLSPIEEAKWAKKISKWIQRQPINRTLIKSKEQPYICEICGKAYSSMENLLAHAYIHTGTLNYDCNYCGKKMGSEKSLNSHVRNLHLNIQSHKCTICGQTFNKKGNLNSHMRLHSSDFKYVCSNCGKGFKWHHGYEVHMRSHTNSKAFKCYVCDKFYQNLNARNKHCTKHHNGEGKRPQGLHPDFRYSSDKFISQTIFGGSYNLASK